MVKNNFGQLIGIALSATISQLALNSIPVSASQLSKIDPISNFFVFGDSLVDDHNLYQLTGGMYPPKALGYFEGRFSNGQVFVESLPEILKKDGYGQKALQYSSANNYAVAGAETNTHELLGSQFGLEGQINTFLTLTSSKIASTTTSSTATVDPDALYLIAAGANDYLSKILAGDFSIDIGTVVNNITQSINDLASAGATNFMVAGLADFTMAPSFSNVGEVEKAILQSISIQHNLALQSSLQTLEQQGLNITYLDLSSILTKSVPNFTNVKDACLNMEAASICTDPDQYLWYDSSHVTAKAHKMLAEQAVESYSQQNGQATSVPEPHTVLGLLAVGGLGLLLRRKNNSEAENTHLKKTLYN